jgi:hypothetical protein
MKLLNYLYDNPHITVFPVLLLAFMTFESQILFGDNLVTKVLAATTRVGLTWFLYTLFRLIAYFIYNDNKLKDSKAKTDGLNDLQAAEVAALRIAYIFTIVKLRYFVMSIEDYNKIIRTGMTGPLPSHYEINVVSILRRKHNIITLTFNWRKEENAEDILLLTHYEANAKKFSNFDLEQILSNADVDAMQKAVATL